MRYFLTVWLFLLFATIALSDTIEVPVIGSFSGFGSSEVYRGQTFASLSLPSFANKITVFVGPTVDTGADFRVLLTEVDSTNGFHPTKVLFESVTFNVPIFPLRRTPDAFVIDLGGLRLGANREYAFILDYFVVANTGYVSMGTGVGANYDEGFAFRFPNGPFFPTGTRQDHFASGWFIDTERDFAFTLDLSTTAPPQITEAWKFILDNGLGSANIILTQQQNGTITSNGNWIYNYQGSNVSGLYVEAPVTIAGTSLFINASGTATNPSNPPGYQKLPFILSINGNALNGKGSGTFNIKFLVDVVPNKVIGTWEGKRVSGSGITAVESKGLPWLLLLLLLED